MQPQEVKFTSVQINMKQVSYIKHEKKVYDVVSGAKENGSTTWYLKQKRNRSMTWYLKQERNRSMTRYLKKERNRSMTRYLKHERNLSILVSEER